MLLVTPKRRVLSCPPSGIYNPAFLGPEVWRLSLTQAWRNVGGRPDSETVDHMEQILRRVQLIDYRDIAARHLSSQRQWLAIGADGDKTQFITG